MEIEKVLLGKYIYQFLLGISSCGKKYSNSFPKFIHILLMKFQEYNKIYLLFPEKLNCYFSI